MVPKKKGTHQVLSACRELHEDLLAFLRVGDRLKVLLPFSRQDGPRSAGASTDANSGGLFIVRLEEAIARRVDKLLSERVGQCEAEELAKVNGPYRRRLESGSRASHRSKAKGRGFLEILD